MSFLLYTRVNTNANVLYVNEYFKMRLFYLLPAFAANHSVHYVVAILYVKVP